MDQVMISLPENHLSAGPVFPQSTALAGNWLGSAGAPVAEAAFGGSHLHFQRSRMPTLDFAANPFDVPALDHQLIPGSWPPVQANSLHLPLQGPHLSDWSTANTLNDNTGLRAFTSASVPLLHSKPSDIELQGLALERMRRDMTRLQTELDKAEREVLRQKSLREAERLEFTDAKDRLKHSWANDRDDFARVKTMLRTKNAEHHAQGGRLSQQLKECEACNRGLRELALRNGIPIPPELETLHVRRPNGKHNGYTEGSLSHRASNHVVLDERVPIPARTSFDSYFQQNEAQQQLACSSSGFIGTSKAHLNSPPDADLALQLPHTTKSA